MENYLNCLIDGDFHEDIAEIQPLKTFSQDNLSQNYSLTSTHQTLQNQDFKNKVKKNRHIKEERSPKKEPLETLSFNHGHWSNEQNQKYHWFLEIHYRHFVNKLMRRLDKIFKVMEIFVGTRQAEQCRSHHQKMQKKYHNFINIISNFRRQHYNDLSPILIEEHLKSHQIEYGESLATIQKLILLQDSKESFKDLSPMPSPCSSSYSIFAEKVPEKESEKQPATDIKIQSQQDKQQQKEESKQQQKMNMLEQSCMNMGWLAISQKDDHSCIFNCVLFDKL